MSTTVAVIRLLALLLKDQVPGRYVVPIVPDEARTFGLEGLFCVAGIYSSQGRNYTPVDADTVLGTDGYGLSEAREALRDYFEISADYIAHAPLVALYRETLISKAQFRRQVATLNIDSEKMDPLDR